LVGALFTLALSFASLATADTASAKSKINVLFIVGGGIHDWKGLSPILKKDLEDTGEFAVTISEDLNRLTTLSKDRVDVVLFYTTGLQFTPEQEKSLIDFVSNGGGWAGIHSASDSFRNSDAYWKLVGGRFAGHGYGTFAVHITVPRHEAVKGISDFEITDEDYNHEFHKDASILVLARRPKDGAPVIWVQNYGRGRVFYTGLGHGKEAWQNPAFKQLMITGIRWAAHRKAPADGDRTSPGGGCDRDCQKPCCAKADNY